MKLYVLHKATNQRTYLNISAYDRNQLRMRFGGDYFSTGDGFVYNVNEVFAEGETNKTAAGSVIGGLIGVLGGPIGLIAGAALGGMIGNNNDEDENRRVNLFNRSM